MNNGYPDGIGVEAFTFVALEQIWENEKDPQKREHIALNFYDYINDKIPNGSTFSVGTISCPQEYSRPDIVLDVNTKEDYKMMKELYEHIYPVKPNFIFTDIIDWYDNHLEKDIINEK